MKAFESDINFSLRKLLIFFLFGSVFTNAQTVFNNPDSLRKAFQTNPENYFRSYGLVDIHEIDPRIKVELKYAGEQNFTGKTLYNGLQKCMVPIEVALQLKKAQDYLNTISEEYDLLILDASRPLHIQQEMWASLELPDKKNYLSPPSELSLHNYGTAIDLTLMKRSGVIVDMGTPFDFFGPEAQPKFEQQMVLNGRLSKEQLLHRKLLRYCMRKAGFTIIQTEWWHFNFCSKAEAEKKFKLIY